MRTTASWPLVILLLAVSTAPSFAAGDSASLEDRVRALEQQNRELSDRMARLEGAAKTVNESPAASAPAASPTPAAVFKPVVPAGPAGWTLASHWKKMRAGLNQDQVLDLLGEPEKRSGGRYRQHWDYADGQGSVDFDSGGDVNEWQAPPVK